MTGVSVIKPGLDYDEKRIIFKPDAEIGPIPAFLRINSILMYGFKPSFTRFLPLFQHFSSAFTDSPHFYSYTYIGQHWAEDSDWFHAPPQFLSCLTQKILPIFNGCRPTFVFSLYSKQIDTIRRRNSKNTQDIMPLIGSILELPHVQASSNVRFFISGQLNPNTQLSLEIDAISDWLQRPFVEPASKYYRTLQISSRKNLLSVHSNSVTLLIDTVKAVRFINLNEQPVL